MSLKFKKSSGFILITWYFFQFIPLYLSLIVTQALAFLKTDAAQICMCMYKYNVIQYNMKFVLSFSFFVFFFFKWMIYLAMAHNRLEYMEHWTRYTFLLKVRHKTLSKKLLKKIVFMICIQIKVYFLVNL